MFVRVCSLAGRYFYNVYMINKFEIVFSLNIKDNNIFPCLRTIRLSYSIKKCFSHISHDYIKYGSFLFKTHENTYSKKGEHSCKCTELSLKRKEGIASLNSVFHCRILYSYTKTTTLRYLQKVVLTVSWSL